MPVGRPSLVEGVGRPKRKMRESLDTTIFSTKGSFCTWRGFRKAAGLASAAVWAAVAPAAAAGGAAAVRSGPT